MKIKLTPLILPVLLFLSFSAYSQTQSPENQFSLSTQIRSRGEYRNGSLFPRSEGDKAAGFISNRARISLGYDRKDLSVKMSAQHVGAWGQDPQVDKNGRFILNEAWARLNFENNFFAQLGRQALVYDDERILGGLDWNSAGRFHDALKLGYENPIHQLHLLLAFNQNSDDNTRGTYYHAGAQPYKSMQTLWYHIEPNQRLKASFLLMNLGLETGDPTIREAQTRYLQTMGTYLTFTPANWKVEGSFYYQTGKNKEDKKVSAFMAALLGTWNFAPGKSIILGTDYLSGNDPKKDKINAFDPLYGTHHKFYGTMDYFYASSFLRGAPGLWDNQIGFRFKPSGKTNLSAYYHYFRAANKVMDKEKELSKNLGSEIDLQLDWDLMKDVKLSAGYSCMFGSKTMDFVKGGDHKRWQDWGWLSLNINPRIFLVNW